MKNLIRINDLTRRLEALGSEDCVLDFLTRLSCRTYDNQAEDCILSEDEEKSVAALENMTDSELTRLMPLLFHIWVTGILAQKEVTASFSERKKLETAKRKREFYSKVDALIKDGVPVEVARFQVWEEIEKEAEKKAEKKAEEKAPGLFKSDGGFYKGHQRWAADRREKRSERLKEVIEKRTTLRSVRTKH